MFGYLYNIWLKKYRFGLFFLILGRISWHHPLPHTQTLLHATECLMWETKHLHVTLFQHLSLIHSPWFPSMPASFPWGHLTEAPVLPQMSHKHQLKHWMWLTCEMNVMATLIWHELLRLKPKLFYFLNDHSQLIRQYWLRIKAHILVPLH